MRNDENATYKDNYDPLIHSIHLISFLLCRVCTVQYILAYIHIHPKLPPFSSLLYPPSPSKLLYDSRLILFPNLAYKFTFNCSISSLTLPNLSSTAETDSSILVMDVESKSRTSSTGREMNVSPILYLDLCEYIFGGKSENWGI